jgi:hypothetical protein
MTAVPLTRPHAEEYHPNRLLGVAQQAMKTALLLDDAEIKAYLTDALASITVPAVVPLRVNDQLRAAEYGPGEVIGIERDKDIALIRWDFPFNDSGQHVVAMGLRWAETECLRGAAA